MEKSVVLVKTSGLGSRLQDYAQLTKMRLASLVVFSAAMAFLLAPWGHSWANFCWLILGGFLVTGSANGFNQVMERGLDKLMDRTSNRPLPDSRMSVTEALVVCVVTGIAGIGILATLNPLSGILGFTAIVLYTLAYTPLKRRTPFAVFVGAIPGAIPPMLGWVAATGQIGVEGWVLFCIQFMWQFPHFWAIAWVLDEDYKKAGFNLLPTGERNKGSAFQALLYTFSLFPVGLVPFALGITGWVSAIIIAVTGFYFLIQAWKLYRDCSVDAARRLMYGSFLYLPVVMIALAADKL